MYAYIYVYTYVCVCVSGKPVSKKNRPYNQADPKTKLTLRTCEGVSESCVGVAPVGVAPAPSWPFSSNRLRVR